MLGAYKSRDNLTTMYIICVWVGAIIEKSAMNAACKYLTDDIKFYNQQSEDRCMVLTQL